VLENVPNIIRHEAFDTFPAEMPQIFHRFNPKMKMGRTFFTICTLLEQENYHLHMRLYNTANVTGIPQNRQRMYLIAFRDKEDFDDIDLDLPPIEKRPLMDFLEQAPEEKYYYLPTTHKYKPTILQEIDANVQNEMTLYQYRRTSVRQNMNGECPTLTANMGCGGHNVPLLRDKKGVRKLTPLECFRFQGFPASYRLSKALPDSVHYKLAGNAVSYPIVEKLAERILATFAKNPA
jgi:DNA (cytosine-5)-methyltransferase 1